MYSLTQLFRRTWDNLKKRRIEHLEKAAWAAFAEAEKNDFNPEAWDKLLDHIIYNLGYKYDTSYTDRIGRTVLIVKISGNTLVMRAEKGIPGYVPPSRVLFRNERELFPY